MEFKYEVGGKKYIQKPLVLAQIKQLISRTQDLEIPGEIDVLELIGLLGDRIPGALAIVLTEKGAALRDKDLDALALELEYSITHETILQVIEDFFVCNPIASLLSKLSGMATQIQTGIKPTGLTTSAPSSPGETLPNETPSSGDSPSENATPISNTESERFDSANK
jgi:hypothetical protein